MRGVYLIALIATGLAGPAHADTRLACTFANLPQIVLTTPSDTTKPTRMSVGDSDEVDVITLPAAFGLDVAEINGQGYEFSRATQKLRIFKEGAVIAEADARCTPVESLRSVALAEDSTAPFGAWQVEIDGAPGDPGYRVLTYLVSETSLPDKEEGTFNPVLVVRCMERTTVAYFAMGNHDVASSDEYGVVAYSIDNGPEMIREMVASDNGKALGLLNGRQSIPFIQELFGAKSLMIHLRPLNNPALEFSFDITNTEAALADLRRACKW